MHNSIRPSNHQSRDRGRGHSHDKLEQRMRRSEHYSARMARMNALQTETDAELRDAVKGTWAELELSGDPVVTLS